MTLSSTKPSVAQGLATRKLELLQVERFYFYCMQNVPRRWRAYLICCVLYARVIEARARRASIAGASRTRQQLISLWLTLAFLLLLISYCILITSSFRLFPRPNSRTWDMLSILLLVILVHFHCLISSPILFFFFLQTKCLHSSDSHRSIPKMQKNTWKTEAAMQVQ